MANPTDTPVNQVIEMRNQGLSNNQIIQNLQRQGYNSTQVYDALNQADMKGGVEPVSADNMQSPEPEKPIPQNPTPETQDYPQEQSQQPQSYDDQYNNQQYAPQFNESYYQPNNIGTEELVESIIDEKWEDLVKDINKVVDWKNKTEARIVKIEQNIENLKENFSQIQKAITGKVGEYDKHIQEVGTDIKALEKVFQKVLPKFTENINELSIITNRFKKGSKSKKSSKLKSSSKSSIKKNK